MGKSKRAKKQQHNRLKHAAPFSREKAVQNAIHACYDHLGIERYDPRYPASFEEITSPDQIRKGAAYAFFVIMGSQALYTACYPDGSVWVDIIPLSPVDTSQAQRIEEQNMTALARSLETLNLTPQDIQNAGGTPWIKQLDPTPPYTALWGITIKSPQSPDQSYLIGVLINKDGQEEYQSLSDTLPY